jgi:hypothetical protein
MKCEYGPSGGVDDPMNFEKEMSNNLDEVTAGHVHRHHAVMREDVVFGGIQDDKSAAKKVQQRLNYFINTHKEPDKTEIIDSYLMIRRQVVTIAKSWIDAPVRRIRQGEKYRLYGRNSFLIHGVDDGTHMPEVEEP